jgi:hypothetical protein
VTRCTRFSAVVSQNRVIVPATPFRRCYPGFKWRSGDVWGYSVDDDDSEPIMFVILLVAVLIAALIAVAFAVWR